MAPILVGCRDVKIITNMEGITLMWQIFKLGIIIKVILRASFGLLVVLVFLFLCPMTITSSYADDFATRAIITPSISLAADQGVDITIMPTGDGQFGQASVNVAIGTTNYAGYSLYTQTNDATTAMFNTNGVSSGEIKALSSPRLPADFENNTWGLALAKEQDSVGVYDGISLTAQKLVESSRATEIDNYTLNIGARIDTRLPAGQYENTILFSVVANPQTIRTLGDLTYMQEMSTLSCENSSLHETKQLIDLRDNKDYWVAKLADGNCWMTQNLALDLNSNKALTSSDTDLNSKSSWTPDTSTETTVPVKEETPNQYATRSWNLGDYFIVNPKLYLPCNQGPGLDKWASVLPGQTLGRCENFQNIAFVESYNAHLLVGNYYQFGAATAGSGNVKISEVSDAGRNVADSICPKGWKMPVSNIDAEPPINGTYDNLFNQYMDEEAGVEQIADAPLYLIKGGLIYLHLGMLRFAGAEGSYTTATMEDDEMRYTAGINGDRVSMGSYSHNNRHVGMFVRCLAR